MDIEQSTKNFLENDFRFLTIGEVARELLECRASIKGLESQIADLQKKLTESANHNKEVTEVKRALEQELAKLKG
jgi:septal ring factor EnvC (AmiA/AmiB activator)